MQDAFCGMWSSRYRIAEMVGYRCIGSLSKC